MNQLIILRNAITSQFSNINAKLTPPADETGGVWFLDIFLANQTLSIQWLASRGFWLTSLSLDDDAEDDSPTEVFRNIDQARERALEIIKTGERTTLPATLPLRQLRESRRFSQEEMASLLGVGQSTVSKIERGSALNVETLRAFIEALGGRLEIRALFQEHAIAVDLGPQARPA